MEAGGRAEVARVARALGRDEGNEAAAAVEQQGPRSGDQSNSKEDSCSPGKSAWGLRPSSAPGACCSPARDFHGFGPYFWIVLTDFWFPVSWYAGLALVTLMFSIYSGARLMGLADMGRKVDLMERSIRRGEGGQAELAEKMEQEERGEYPGA